MLYFDRNLVEQRSVPLFLPILAPPSFKSNRESWEALLSNQKAVSISHDTPSPNYSEMANSYYNIGFVYFKMGKYSNVRPFYERALHIAQSSFPSHHFLLRHYREKLNSLKEQL